MATMLPTMPAQVMTASEAFCDVPEHSSASYTEYDAPENRHCNNADWADATPEATPYSWYEFFLPSRVKEMVERRRKQFETVKLFFVLMSDPENVKVRKDVVQKLLSDVEVLMIPALQEERHGAESINELRQEIFDAMHNLTIHMVDIVPEDGEEGSIISIRTICKATQVKPIFPHLPVGVPVQIGMKLSVALNSAWRPRASCWNFIPVEPLLEICNMQDMVKLMDTTSTTTRPSTPSSAPSPPTSPDGETEVCGDLESSLAAEMEMSEEQLAAHKAKKEGEHACGICVPCSFHAFRPDGCRRGDACEFCHTCTPAEARARRKQRRKDGKIEKKQ